MKLISVNLSNKMSTFLVILTLFLKLSLVIAASHDENVAFLKWRGEFNIDYTDNETESKAFSFFCQNRKRIETHNKMFFACNSSYALGLWKKSDMNDTVVNRELNGLEAALEISGRSLEVGGRALTIGGVPILEANVTDLNYVDMGYITSVQDQGEVLKKLSKIFLKLS